MQRTGVLIERLQQQYNQSAPDNELAITAQLLLAELQKTYPEPETKGYVTVSLPYIHPVDVSEKNIASPPVTDEPVQEVLEKVEQEKLMLEMPAEAEVIEEKIIDEPKPAETIVDEPKPFELSVEEKPTTIISEVPTFVLKQQELNEKNASKGPSLHDKYKSDTAKAGLQTEPIKDLRKAIGINDRYRFISELFRGDEIMYERSIKTINTFSILAEAEYWISRELKLKLGWSDESETVKDFDQLVKRRFA